MTIQTYIHTSSQRAEPIALVDSGATENFINLQYAKWLKLPIKQLEKPRKLFNVDGTENKAGELKYYTDLETRTEGRNVKMRYFLSNLGEHKVILGYPWFAAFQPKIDWKNGWIDHSQLPVVIRTPNAAKAQFIPRTKNVPRTNHEDQYFIGRVTFHNRDGDKANLEKIPPEY